MNYAEYKRNLRKTHTEFVSKLLWCKTEAEKSQLSEKAGLMKCEERGCKKAKYASERMKKEHPTYLTWRCKEHILWSARTPVEVLQGHQFSVTATDFPEPSLLPEPAAPSALSLPTLPPPSSREARLASAFRILAEEGCTAGEFKVLRRLAETQYAKWRNCSKCGVEQPEGRFSFVKDGAPGQRHKQCVICYMTDRFVSKAPAKMAAAPQKEEAHRECRRCEETKEIGEYGLRKDGSRKQYCKDCAAKWAKKMRRGFNKST